MTTTATENTTTSSSLFDEAELAAILGEDEFSDQATAEATHEEVDDELVKSLEEEDELDRELKESLKSTASEEPIEEAAEEEALEVAGAKEAKPEKARAKASRSGTAGMMPSEAIVKLFGEEVIENGLLLEHEADTVPYDSLDGLAKKVREKVVNALDCAKRGATPSVYTKIALDLLVSRKEITSDDIRNQYLARPYSPGTASAQASQMMIALPALKLAHREGKKLVLNENSTLLQALVSPVATSEEETE